MFKYYFIIFVIQVQQKETIQFLNNISSDEKEICLYKIAFVKLGTSHPFIKSTLFCWNDSTEITIPLIINNFISISKGRHHYCIVNIYHSIICDGINNMGQCDVPDHFHEQSDLISSGYFHSCGTMHSIDSSMISCWGWNFQGQTSIPDVIQLEAWEIEQLVSGPYTTCTLINDYHTCWGKNSQYFDDKKAQYHIGSKPIQTSIGARDTICKVMKRTLVFQVSISCYGRCLQGMCIVPFQLRQMNKQVSVGRTHVCTIAHRLGCWGLNDSGQLNIPKLVQKYAVAVSAGSSFTCAVSINIRTACWGSLSQVHRQLKLYTLDVAAGGRNSCAILNGEVGCIGENSFSQLKVPDSIKYVSTSVKVGWDFSCAIGQEGRMECWGLNWLGQTQVPVKLSKKNVSQLGVGLAHSCAIYSTAVNMNSVKCWGGNNEYGQNSPPYLFSQEMVATGDDHSCVTYLQSVYCFGKNDSGQSDLPENLSKTTVKSIYAGGGHNCAILKYLRPNNLICWGINNQGQCTIPLNSLASGEVESMSAGSAHTCIVFNRLNGTQFDKNLWLNSSVICWGLRTNQSELKVSLQPRLVAAGWMHDCMVDWHGEVNCWGDEEDNQCNWDQQVSLQVG